ncbi:MAG: hypothetical protein LBF17_00910 [Mediterranea sp.]|jgi:hypothetical protein|nr:hypothetical protein [Mediterranea sp.]
MSSPLFFHAPNGEAVRPIAAAVGHADVATEEVQVRGVVAAATVIR